MQKSFDKIFQEALKLRREQKPVIKDTNSIDEINAIQQRQHIDDTFFFNARFGKFGSFNNATAR